MWPTQPIPSIASGVSPPAKDSSKEALARSQSPLLRAAQPASSGAARTSSSAISFPSKNQARKPGGEEREGRALAPLLHGRTLTPASDYRQARRSCRRFVTQRNPIGAAVRRPAHKTSLRFEMQTEGCSPRLATFARVKIPNLQGCLTQKKRMKGLEPSTFCMANVSSDELGERRR